MGRKNLPYEQRRPKKNPCNSSPAAPTVTMTFRAIEALTHLRFDAKIKWTEVTDDEDTFPTKVDVYDIAYIACQSDGTPVDVEDLKTRYHVQRKAPVSHVGITEATAAANVATFTTAREHGWLAGDHVTVEDMVPAGYNGDWTVASAPDATSFTANIGATPADATDFGRALDNDDSLHVITGRLPRPRIWYWKARVRAKNAQGCWGKWSPWTTPALPWTGADPQPPAPTGVTLTWDRVGKERGSPLRGIVAWNEVVDFDYPGTPADDEDDLAAYAIKVEISDDGVTGDDKKRYFHREAKDADADTTAQMAFHHIHKKWYYRASVRSIDRFNRRGPWSTPTAWAQPNDNTAPPAPSDVLVFESSTDRAVIKWTEPTDADDTDLLDLDVAHFQAQISESATFATIYDFDRHIDGRRRSFKIADADKGGTFYLRARSVDASGNKSSWIPGITTPPGNDDPGASAVGVTIGSGGGGKTKIPFSVRGYIRSLAETDVQDIDIDEALTLKKIRLRLKQSIVGGTLTITPYKNNSTALSTVTITTGNRRGVRDDYATSFADGDSISLAIDVPGGLSQRPRGLTAFFIFDPV